MSENLFPEHHVRRKLANTAAAVLMLAAGQPAETMEPADTLPPVVIADDANLDSNEGSRPDYLAVAPASSDQVVLPEMIRRKFPKSPEVLVRPDRREHDHNGQPIPKSIEKIMRTETVYLAGNGCSGFLVRNSERTPVGVVTAEHCSLRDVQTKRLPGNDGNTYIVLDAPVVAKRGNDLDHLKKGREIDQFIVQPKGETSSDLAFGVFSGHTPEEVIDNYNHLSEKEIEALPQGETVFMSGWPVDQDNNSGARRRQSFAMSVLGTGTTHISSGEVMKVLWAAVPSSQDGAECSFGASGSAGYVAEQVRDQEGNSYWTHQSVGTLAVFDDLIGDTYRTPAEAAQMRALYEDQFKVDLSGFAAVCGFSYSPLPTPKNGGEVVNVVSDRQQIPGYSERLTPEYQMDKARVNFFDPDYQRAVIDGIAKVTTKDGPQNEDELLIDRPVIFYDDITEQVVVGWHDSAAPDNLSLKVLPDIYSVELYGRADSTAVSILAATGEVEVAVDQAGNQLTGFGTADLASFGRAFPKSINSDGARYGLAVSQDGQLYTVELIIGGDKGGGPQK